MHIQQEISGFDKFNFCDSVINYNNKQIYLVNVPKQKIAYV